MSSPVIIRADPLFWGGFLVRADRLLSILLLLQARGRLTGRELSRRLEVSPRTVHRDMEALSAAGVPVFALRGVRGGWQLDEGWRTRVPGLDEVELRALLMAQPRVVGDSRLARAAERALEVEPGAEGWVTLQVQFDDEAQASFVVLGLGPRVDVLEPESLRARVAADHAAAVERAARVGSAPEDTRRPIE